MELEESSSRVIPNIPTFWGLYGLWFMSDSFLLARIDVGRSQELVGVALSRRYGWRSIRLAAILETSGNLLLEEAKVDHQEKKK